MSNDTRNDLQHLVGEIRKILEPISQSVGDAAIRREILLALGLDPERATLFVQSDVPEVSELCWILMTVTPMGLLERCHAYKDKKAKGLTADTGLFAYPVLMAADILAYDSDVVPVGEDQVQHIEVTRDLAAARQARATDGSPRPPTKSMVDSRSHRRDRPQPMDIAHGTQEE